MERAGKNKKLFNIFPSLERSVFRIDKERDKTGKVAKIRKEESLCQPEGLACVQFRCVMGDQEESKYYTFYGTFFHMAVALTEGYFDMEWWETAHWTLSSHGCLLHEAVIIYPYYAAEDKEDPGTLFYEKLTSETLSRLPLQAPSFTDQLKRKMNTIFRFKPNKN